MGVLIVLRHAKAVEGLGTADVDRALAPRGRRDAAAAGDHLRAAGLRPDYVLCSPATRTRQTLAALALGPDPTVEYERDIYAADADTLFDLVQRTGDEVGTLLLIGHNPSVHQFVHDLTGGAGPDAFPTCALAVLDLTLPWPGLSPQAAAAREVWTPKG